MRTFLRCVDQALVIDQDVHVVVLEIQDDHVRLGITTPRQVPTYREEVLYLLDVEEIGSLCPVAGSNDGDAGDWRESLETPDLGCAACESFTTDEFSMAEDCAAGTPHAANYAPLGGELAGRPLRTFRPATASR